MHYAHRGVSPTDERSRRFRVRFRGDAAQRRLGPEGSRSIDRARSLVRRLLLSGTRAIFPLHLESRKSKKKPQKYLIHLNAFVF